MSKYCMFCGSQLNDNARFCPSCGKAQSEPQNNSSFQYSGNGCNRREIAISIILSLVTCGIYGLIWLAGLNDDINSLSGENGATSGGMVVLLSIVTCGIYLLYWYYTAGKRLKTVTGETGSDEILYLVLGLFGLGIISMALMQDKVNKIVG